MTKDDFRKFQKDLCRSGAPNHVGIYGCHCCRKIDNLNAFKKWSRKLARTRAREGTRRLIHEGMNP